LQIFGLKELLRMKKLSVGLALLLCAGGAHAIDVGLGAKVGINGLGVDLSLGLTKNVNLRLSAAALDIEGEEETITVGDSGAEGDLDAELDFDYGATAAFLDWHVFGGGFRLTAGMLKNNGAADFQGTLLSDIVVDGENLSPSDINGAIGGELSLGDSYQPYLGIGWGRGAGDGGGLSIMIDLGVAMVEPSADFEATVNSGGINGLDQAELDRRLRQIEKDAEDDLDDLELWPVASIGINYAF
jgi:hypothetical protein